MKNQALSFSKDKSKKNNMSSVEIFCLVLLGLILLPLLYSEVVKAIFVSTTQLWHFHKCMLRTIARLSLTLKAPNKNSSRRPFIFLFSSFEENKA